MWEEHCYHFKSDWSQKKLKRHLKQRLVSHIRITKNKFLNQTETIKIALAI